MLRVSDATMVCGRVTMCAPVSDLLVRAFMTITKQRDVSRVHCCMTIAEAQKEMRVAYGAGAVGMFTSAAAWCVAGTITALISAERGVWALFIGGALIHPVAQLLLRAFGRTARHAPDNPLGKLALESTVWMLLCLPLAYGVSRYRMEWFFPAMLFVIGGRYLTFATLFGWRVYWLCGGTLVLASYALFQYSAPPAIGAFAGAVIETVFACYLLIAVRKEAAASLVLAAESRAR